MTRTKNDDDALKGWLDGGTPARPGSMGEAAKQQVLIPYLYLYFSISIFTLILFCLFVNFNISSFVLYTRPGSAWAFGPLDLGARRSRRWSWAFNLLSIQALMLRVKKVLRTDTVRRTGCKLLINLLDVLIRCEVHVIGQYLFRLRVIAGVELSEAQVNIVISWINLIICLFICLFICCINLIICLSICLFICCINLIICLYICLFIGCINLIICLSICLFICCINLIK